ncbi:hypothetical protein B0O99DRAFT_644511 [Bisporella sp. PMI_857]|nr:hypothetical protein B0O99DRAFT_644511 [Bisporella sp. PMI_857]
MHAVSAKLPTDSRPPAALILFLSHRLTTACSGRLSTCYGMGTMSMYVHWVLGSSTFGILAFQTFSRIIMNTSLIDQGFFLYYYMNGCFASRQ